MRVDTHGGRGLAGEEMAKHTVLQVYELSFFATSDRPGSVLMYEWHGRRRWRDHTPFVRPFTVALYLQPRAGLRAVERDRAVATLVSLSGKFDCRRSPSDHQQRHLPPESRTKQSDNSTKRDA